MKKIIILFLLISNLLFSQTKKDKVFYLDSLKTETTVSEHKFYRVVKDYHLDRQRHYVTQYYASGKIESEGITTDKNFFNPEGKVISYYENSNKKSQIIYKDFIKVGDCEFWYENGTKKIDGKYFEIDNDGMPSSILNVTNFWNENGEHKVQNGTGDFIDDEKENYGHCLSSGKVKNGFKDGLWTGSDKQNEFSFEENYENGKLIAGVSTDKNNTKFNYTKVSKRPEFKDGISGLYKYMKLNLNLPPNVTANGKLKIGFTIDKNGTIKELKILKSLHPDIDKEAIRIFKEYKYYISPAESRGIKVSSKFVQTMSLQMEN